jgi:hypothetical protein
MDDVQLLGAWFSGPSWDAWRAILRGAYALPMSAAERETFLELTGREPPRHRVKELWILAGRRAGKDSVASLIAAYAAAFVDYRRHLRPGERAAILCLAVDRQQAAIVHRYISAYFSQNALLASLVERETSSGLELSTGAEIIISTSDYRSVRGRSIALAILDEVCFWPDESAVSPDTEVYNAIVPGMATLPGAMLVATTTVYSKRGLAYAKWRKHYGVKRTSVLFSHDDDDVLVVQAPSRALNPTLPQAIVDAAMADDPIAAGAEWLSQWRSDVDAFVSREVIEACTVAGRHELAPVPGLRYAAFVDPSGGSADSMTLSIAHRDATGIAVLDAVREVRPPFSPDSTVRDFAALLKSYRINRVTGDRYGGEWPRERFRVHGIAYDLAEKPKSDLYRECLPLLNAGRVELLDHARLAAQLIGLERRTSRGGRDSIDHQPNSHDDIANSVAGALLATSSKAPMRINEQAIAKLSGIYRFDPLIGGEPASRVR